MFRVFRITGMNVLMGIGLCVRLQSMDVILFCVGIDRFAVIVVVVVVVVVVVSACVPLRQIKASWLHFLLVSMTQNDLTDTLYPFCQSRSHTAEKCISCQCSTPLHHNYNT